MTLFTCLILAALAQLSHGLTQCVSTAGVSNNCDPGFYCFEAVDGNKQCSPCSTGYYKIGNEALTACSVCPAGSYCPATYVQPIFCPAFTYGVNVGQTASTACTSCPLGRYSSALGADSITACTPCPAGTWSSSAINNLSDCVQCGAGTYQPNEGANIGSACLNCPPGTFSPNLGTGLLSSCNFCPLGKYSGSTGATSASVCVACPVGKWSTTPGISGLSQCQTCPGGSYCPSLGGAPIPCPAGTLWVTPASGGPSISSSVCVVVPDGFYTAAGATYQIICPAGYYCPTKASVPMTVPLPRAANPCPFGLVADRYNDICMSLPIPCPLGFYYNGPSNGAAASSNVCVECKQGTFINGELPAAIGLVSCIPCTPGYYCPTPSIPRIKCAVGKYVVTPAVITPESLCKLCPTYAANSGATNCPGIGMIPYCELDNTQCKPCPLNFFCVDPTQVPVPCPAGRYGVETGQGSASGCATCLPGYYCDGITGTAQICPTGRYNSQYGQGALVNCALCPAGSYSTTEGSTVPCTLCPAGFYCPTNPVRIDIYDQEPVPCPAGFYGPNPGQWLLNSATSCSSFPCQTGTYSPVIAATSATTCITCPLGKYQDSLGAGSETDCKTCPAGSYCPAANTAPIVCPQGFYSTQTDCGTNPQSCEVSNVCSMCPAGTYSGTPGAISASACAPCPQGFFCPWAGSAIGCPAGTYGNAAGAQDSSVCLACAIGTYNSLTGQASVTSCLACPAGSFCPSNSMKVDCPAGWYSTQTSMVDSTTCLPCPLGSYCPTPNSLPLTCPAGTFGIAAGASACASCAVGRYSSVVSSIDPADCLQCSAGTYSIVPGAASAAECLVCPAGYYCGSAAVLPVMCVAGKYSLTRATQCTDCECGTFSNGAGKSSCQFCPTTTYMPLNVNEQATNSSCIFCPAGKQTGFGSACGLSACVVPSTFDVGVIDDGDTQGGGIAGSLVAVFVGLFCTWYYIHQKQVKEEKLKKNLAEVQEHHEEHADRMLKAPAAPQFDANGVPIEEDLESPTMIFHNDADEGIAENTINPMVDTEHKSTSNSTILKVDVVDTIVEIAPGEHWIQRKNEQGRKYWQNNVTHEKTFKNPSLNAQPGSAVAKNDEL